MTIGLIAPDDDAKNKRLYPSRAFKKLTSGLSDANIAYDVTYAFVGLDNVKKQLSNLFSYAKLPSVETDGKVEIIEAKNRDMAGRTAPPEGLFLLHVDYEGERETV